MRRILAIVVIVFSLLPINSSIAAVPAQGNSCSKLGVIQVYKGTKYTCTKSGKKLIWTKTPIRPSVSVSPSAKPNSGNNSANTPSPTYVNSINAEVNRACEVNGEESFPLSGALRCSANFWRLIPEANDSVASRAFRSLISKYNKNENATVNIKFFEESSSGASTILLKRSMVAAARLWNQKNLPQEPYPVLIGRTLDWLKKSALENNLTPNFGWTNIENQFRDWKECSYAEFYSTTGQPWYVFCYSQPAEQINKDLSFLQVGAHEYTHLIQFHLSNSFYRNNGDPLPPWLQEGFAMFVGTMLGGSTLVDNNLRIQLINQLKGTNTPLSDYKYRFPEKWNDIYPLGGFATEALVALKGIEVMETMCSKLAEGKTSEQAILLATGKDLNYWTELGQGYVDSIKQGKPWTLDELRNKS